MKNIVDEFSMGDPSVGLRADDPEDVKFLAEMIDGLGNHVRPQFASAVIAAGIMRPKGFIFRLGLWISTRRRNVYGWVMRMCELQPDLADSIIEQTAEHCLNGKDLTSPRSVGGFNQKEVYICMAIFLALAKEQKAA